MCTFHATHQAMARTIFPRPGIIVHSPVGPCTQGLDGHEIRDCHFAHGAGKFGLEHIATAQVALKARDSLIGRRYLKVATPFGIEQPAKEGRAIKVR